MSDKLFSLDNPKAVKAQGYGWLNAIHYMAPASVAGVGNLCPFASDGCKALCLGEHSGNAAMFPSVMKSRIAKARTFMTDRPAYVANIIKAIRAAGGKAEREGLQLCVRLNGSTDIAWEGVAPQIFTLFPYVQFVDYTKSPTRALAHARGKLPRNYHLTFSRSEANESDCLRVLEAGGNVAVVFAGEKPIDYLGAYVIDGDSHDLRHMDFHWSQAHSKEGVIIGLTPKGRKAKADKSGFVVRP